MIDSLCKRLPPLSLDQLELPNDELGKILRDLCIMGQAEARGINVQNNPQAKQVFGERFMESIQQLPDDYCDNTQNDALFLALRLAAQGNFESAGKKLKDDIKTGSEYMAAMNAISNLDGVEAVGLKVVLGGKKGSTLARDDTAIEKQRRERLDFLDLVRLENPKATDNKIYTIAAAESKDRLGETVSLPTFYRADKKK
ncbi:MAG: hypothetical protein QX189_09490 [Methylococcales bacterium]